MLPVKTNPVPFMDQDKAVVIHILGRQSVWSVGAFNLVCKDWNQLIQSKYFSNYVWQAVARLQFPSIDLKEIPDFRSYQLLDSNLIRGVYSLKVLPGARNPIVVIGDDQLLSTSVEDRSVIMKWDWKNQTCTGVFKGHEGEIASMAVSEDGKFLFSRGCVSRDSSVIKKWDIEKCSCLATCQEPKALRERGSKVLVLAQDDQIFTNSANGSIEVRDAASWDLIHTFPCEDSSVVMSWAVDDEKERLFTGHSDGKMRIWSLASPWPCIATREPDVGHEGKHDAYDAAEEAIQPILVNGSSNKVFFGSTFDHGSSVRSWDYEKGISTVLFGDHGNWGCPMAVNAMAGVFFSGFSDLFSYLRICKTDDLGKTKGPKSVLIKLHKSCMRELFEKDGVLFSSADRGVKILDFTKNQRKILEEIAGGIAAQDQLMANEEDSDDGFASSDDSSGDTPLKRMANRGQEIAIKGNNTEFHGCVWREGKVWGHTSYAEEQSYSDDSEDVTDSAIERFSRLPQSTQQAIFEKLDEILRHDNPDYNGYPEDAFYDENGQSATAAQKAEAIYVFLESQASRN